VVVDEACQATEPGTWPPLLLGERALLAGDPLQLPPTIVSAEASARGLAISLFERLWARLGATITTRLVEQRRMHAAIMRYPSEALYEGALVAHPAVAAHRLLELPGVAASPLTDAPLALLDTAGAGWDDRPEDEGESRENPEEARLAARVVHRLLALGVAPGDVGVLTPYAAQARRIRELVGHEAVEVDTVDGFQGREKEAIVVSLVRSSAEGGLGFVADVRRMNVAITRARRKLVLIGDGATLAGHAFHAGLLEAFAAEDAHGTVWDLAAADLE
jgi:superfamily I DNA and/or RNA helicase